MNITCAICGQSRPLDKMISRKLNGRRHFCCSINCEVQWEKMNLMGVCG